MDISQEYMMYILHKCRFQASYSGCMQKTEFGVVVCPKVFSLAIMQGTLFRTVGTGQ